MATRQQLEQQFIQDRAFWGSIGSRWRGLAGGVLVGGLIGITLGLAAAGVFSAVAGVAFAEMGHATLLGLVGFFGGSGMLVGGGLWGAAGQVSGAVASGLMAQKELDPVKSKELQKEITIPNDMPEQQSSQKKQPLFNLKVMALGALITGSVGAFLAFTGALPASAGYALLGQQTGTAMGAASAGVTLGLFGSVFGIAFRPFQKFKEWTDGLFEGKVDGRTPPTPDQLKAVLLDQAKGIEKTEQEPVMVKRHNYVDSLAQERFQNPVGLRI